MKWSRFKVARQHSRKTIALDHPAVSNYFFLCVVQCDCDVSRMNDHVSWALGRDATVTFQ